MYKELYKCLNMGHRANYTYLSEFDDNQVVSGVTKDFRKRACKFY